jgi:hypothetical protein
MAGIYTITSIGMYITQYPKLRGGYGDQLISTANYPFSAPKSVAGRSSESMTRHRAGAPCRIGLAPFVN